MPELICMICAKTANFLTFAMWRQLRLMKTNDEMQLLYLLISQQLMYILGANEWHAQDPTPPC